MHLFTIFKIQVRNSGPGVVSESYVNISWPYEVGGNEETGKYLLYLMRKPKVSRFRNVFLILIIVFHLRFVSL